MKKPQPSDNEVTAESSGSCWAGGGDRGGEEGAKRGSGNSTLESTFLSQMLLMGSPQDDWGRLSGKCLHSTLQVWEIRRS